jgi:hypothetical protein
MTATATSWARIPFGEGVLLPYTANFDAAQTERLMHGLIPKEMEDKWFIFYERPHLFFHRSWTGQPVYRITLAHALDRMKVLEALWSKDLAEAGNSDLEYQAKLVDFLISNLLLDEHRPFPRPAGLKEPAPGVYQHHISGTGYPDVSSPPRKSWWKFW